MTVSELEKLIMLALLTKEGFEFEKFVVDLYKIIYGDQFIGVASGGGDDGNDGTNGDILIQVYGPADLKGSNAIAKMNEDYTKAKKKWDFKEWHYVINSKTNDAPAKVVKELHKLQESEKPIKIKLIDSSTVKSLIIKAWEEYPLKLYVLLNFDTNIDNFKDFEKISKVIDFVADIDDVKKIDMVDFRNFDEESFFQGKNEKIKINIKEEDFRKKFTKIVQNSRVTIEEFKDKIGEEYLEEVGEYIKRTYSLFVKDMSEEFAIMETYHKIYTKLKNDQNLSIALWIVIGYFFDICDIGKKDNGNG